jgi:glycosyltransferase involved in cell wall biosynthesis/ubiquinone/menaquinone biosynthesis C-methylase UbiE
MAKLDSRSVRLGPRVALGENVDRKTVAGFGQEWVAFSQSRLGGKEYEELFRTYFGMFPFGELPPNAEGFDLGCGSGRWAIGVAPSVGKLHCIDPAREALDVARVRLRDFGNVEFHLASASDIPLADGSQDFGYSLGVFHHIPDTGRAIADAVRKLKPGAPFLLYIYYRLENRPKWYRVLWRCTDVARRVISRLPFPMRYAVTNAIAVTVYWPLARLARMLSRAGIDSSNIPLNGYRDLSFYVMRTDALDRFGTRLEQRFTRDEISHMMAAAGLRDVQFRETEPYWIACGRAGPGGNERRETRVIAQAFPVSRPRVLHVISGLGPGGAETVLYRLTTHSPNFDHEVISLSGRDWYSSRLEASGIAVRHIRSASVVSVIPGLIKLYWLMRKSRADLVQAWMYRGNFMAGICSRLAGKPVLWNIRCSTLEPLRLGSRILARAGGKLARWIPDYVINCSVESARLHASLGYDRAEGGVIANGYDPEIFFPDDRRNPGFRESLGIDAQTFMVGAIGRWHPQKGLPELLRSLRALNDRGISARLLMAGRGLSEANADLMRLIDETGCRDLTILLGERSDIPDIARVPDVHVLASIGTEGFPNVVAETMLSGTPNVVTNIGDAARIVGDTGWVVEPKNSTALADGLESAYREWRSSPAAWKQRRESARQRIIDNFTLERMVQSYENVWLRVTESCAK